MHTNWSFWKKSKKKKRKRKLTNFSKTKWRKTTNLKIKWELWKQILKCFRETHLHLITNKFKISIKWILFLWNLNYQHWLMRKYKVYIGHSNRKKLEKINSLENFEASANIFMNSLTLRRKRWFPFYIILPRILQKETNSPAKYAMGQWYLI